MARTTLYFTALFGLSSLLLGCQTTSGGGQETASARAVICAKCETVWVERIDLNDPYGMTFRPEETTVCPDCESAVATFFKTGKLEHTCRTCGGQIKHCEVHRR